MTRYYLGLDLGQRRDHSALALLERVNAHVAWQDSQPRPYVLRHIERIPLGTPWQDVVTYTRAIVRDRRIAGQCVLAVDATGVGCPVVEMLAAAQLGCEITAVTITSGDREQQRPSAGSVLWWSVPKRDLMNNLVVLLEQRLLRIPTRLRECHALIREFADIRLSSGENGRFQIGAGGYNQHDDLVLALSLAVWRAKKHGYSGFGTQRLL